jgi:16S rRNA (cytidine1402-2'-O)-methyltransferase
MKNSEQSGTLYIVATPIGNLADMTFRAVDILKSVDLIAAEDTRHSKRLLNHYGINTRLISCHEHNEEKRAKGLVEDLKSGNNIALISDAGTPTISDPGYKLVAAAANEGIDIIPIPGCCAAITGLSVSGLPTDHFLFLGFPPKKQNKLKLFLENLQNQSATLVFYESPKRVAKLIETAIDVLGDRQAMLAREITKLHEEYLRGTLSEIKRAIQDRDAIKGECALMITGCSTEPVNLTDDQLISIILNELRQTRLGTSDLAGRLADRYQLPKKRFYNLIIKIKKEPR